MNNFNNLYNFKNTIRYFFNLDKLDFKNTENLKFDELAWAKPVKFKIFKTEESQRIISFPNILNFFHTCKSFERESNFFKIKDLSKRKRVDPDLSIGEFSIFSYENSIQRDFFNLVKFDKLLILDIKNFYGRIYLHDFNFLNGSDLEQRIGSLNVGRTNGILLGSYLSLYLGERYLLRIENDLDNELVKNNIDCYYEYFSDDFYFFCRSKDIDKIKNIFSYILEKNDLQINDDKMEVLDFEEYTKNNNLDKLWKKVINISREKDEKGVAKRKMNKDYLTYPAFLTQLVYRLSQIKEVKYKRVFLVNFFKTYYFNSLNPKLYILSESDFNYLCYIYKLMPECIIYSFDTIKNMNGFKVQKFKEFILSRFVTSLNSNRFEEQVYFYYAIHELGIEKELSQYKKEILDSENQVLISYCFMDDVIDKNSYTIIQEEGKWLQNYHYLLKYNKSGINILIPENAKKTKQKNSYIKFYNQNIKNNIPIIKPINEIKDDINKYLKKRLDCLKNEKIL